MYKRLVAERAARFLVVDQIHSRMPNVAQEDVEKDVAEAIADIRATSTPGDS
ncbi:MAG: hypothetical protein GTO18_15005 [Anaerolineales bacterium]|nr:hypothetical protein [Anaerolineales bacterium]